MCTLENPYGDYIIGSTLNNRRGSSAINILSHNPTGLAATREESPHTL